MANKTIDLPQFTAALKAGKEVLHIEKEKQDKKNTFFNIKIMYGGIKHKGDFIIRNFRIRAMADPTNTKDRRNDYKSTRMQIETTIADLGEYGPMFLLFSQRNLELINALREAGKIPKSFDISPIVQTHRKDIQDGEEVLIPLENPIVRFKFDMDVYPDTHPITEWRGKAKSVIRDWASRKKDDKGRLSFDVAHVDGAPATEANIHRFVNRGAVCKHLKFQHGSITCAGSPKKVASEMFVVEAIIETVVTDSAADYEGLDDDEPTPATTPQGAAETTEVAEVAEAAEAVDEEALMAKMDEF